VRDGHPRTGSLRLDASRVSPRWCVRSATRDANPATACYSVIWSMSPLKCCPAAFAIATSLFAPLAHANDALEAKERAYVPVVSLAKVCDIRINDSTLSDHRAMLEAMKSDRLTLRPVTEVNGPPSARTSSQPTANTPRRASPLWSRTT